MNIKITRSGVIISIVGVVLIASIIVALDRCKAVPKDNSQAIIDSITTAQKQREDSLNMVIAHAEETEAIARSNADKYYQRSEELRFKADGLHIQFLAARAKYDNLKANGDTAYTNACDEAITAAGETIGYLDSSLVSKEETITEYKRANAALVTQLQASDKSREGFKADFMRLKVGVIPPMQAQLNYANKQWAANRFWKKTFAGGLAVAIIYGTVATIKH